MQDDPLMRVLDASRGKLIDRWTKEAQSSSLAYAEIPEEEIRNSVEKMLDGLRMAVSEGDYSDLFDLLESLVPKRISSGVRLSEIQKIINIGTRLVLEELRLECWIDEGDDCYDAIGRLLEISTWASMNLTDKYEDIRQKESISRTLAALGATQEEMDQREILRRSLEFSVNLAGCTHGAVVMQHLGGCAVFFPESDGIDETFYGRLAGQTMRAAKVTVSSEEDIASQVSSGHLESRTMLSSAFGIPIWARGRVRGAMILGSTRPKELSDHETRLLSAICNQIGLACENARMMELLMHKAENIKAQHDEIVKMMNELGAMVYVADMDTYEILAVNKPLLDTYGDGLIGRRCYEVLQEGQIGPCSFCTNRHLVKDGKSAGAYVWKMKNPRSGRWYQCLDRAIEWTDGRLVRLEIALDVSDLESAKAQVDRMSEMIMVYNSLLVHDITNHAASARALVQLMTDDSIPKEKRDSMNKSALLQIEKIESLVDRVSKIIKAKTIGAARLSEVDLIETLDAAIADAKAIPGLEDIEYRREYPASDCRARTGEFAHDIFLNLLTNAARYGAGRPVIVRLEESVLRGEPSWTISVIDEGGGIRPERRDTLYQPYERLTTVRDIKGLGLGLMIVRELTHAYGGSVELEDRVEGDHTKGSVFRVTFARP